MWEFLIKHYCAHLSEDEGDDITRLPEAGVEERRESARGEGVEHLRAVEHVVQALVTPPTAAHWRYREGGRLFHLWVMSTRNISKEEQDF